jgi:hypothetical protein
MRIHHSNLRSAPPSTQTNAVANRKWNVGSLVLLIELSLFCTQIIAD